MLLEKAFLTSAFVGRAQDCAGPAEGHPAVAHVGFISCPPVLWKLPEVEDIVALFTAVCTWLQG